MLSDFKNKVIVAIPTDFLIAIIFGRVLQIISNNNIINNKTGTLEVTLSLGKEILVKYLFLCYENDKRKNFKFKFYTWEVDNPLLVTALKDSQNFFELEQILLNIIARLKYT